MCNELEPYETHQFSKEALDNETRLEIILRYEKARCTRQQIEGTPFYC